jgi:hypothetical protein
VDAPGALGRWPLVGREVELALRLREAGADAELIASGVGIPREAVSSFLAIARAKLDELTEPNPPLPGG